MPFIILQNLVDTGAKKTQIHSKKYMVSFICSDDDCVEFGLDQKNLPHECKTSASPCSSLQREVNISDISELFKKRSHILGSSAKLDKIR